MGYTTEGQKIPPRRGDAGVAGSKARKHALHSLRRAMVELGDRAVRGDSAAGKMLAAWMKEMLADLDGPSLSAMELEVLRIARMRKLIVDSIGGYIVERMKGPGLVIDETLAPIVKEWSHLADGYTRNLELLGLKSRRRSQSLDEYIAAKSTAVRQANVVAPDEQTPPGEKGGS
jgi:hypothetical protein